MSLKYTKFSDYMENKNKQVEVIIIEGKEYEVPKGYKEKIMSMVKSIGEIKEFNDKPRL
jgi:hypothetical protein